jgi:hypothetical protein
VRKKGEKRGRKNLARVDTDKAEEQVTCMWRRGGLQQKGGGGGPAVAEI